MRPNSYWLYQSNQYDSNLPCLQDNQCSVVARFEIGDKKNRSADEDLVLLNCTQPSTLFDGIIGTEIPFINREPTAQDLLIHYTWKSGITPHPFVAMTFDPPLEELTGVTLHLYREGRLDIRAPYISICVSSLTSFQSCTEVLMETSTPVLFLNITFEHERGPGDSGEYIFLSEVSVSGREQQPPPPGM